MRHRLTEVEPQTTARTTTTIKQMYYNIYMSVKRKIIVLAKDGIPIKLTPQQKAYADIKASNPTMPLAEVARRAYPNAKGATPHQIVNQNENNQAIRIYSDEQVKDAKLLIHSIVNNSKSKDRDRLTASIDILNREYGTPTQNVNVNSKVLTLNIDLTSTED